jgi:hypothetical protein
MQILKNKLNLMASIAMIYMVVGKKKKENKIKNLLGNRTWVGRTIGKHATT